ncbi:MAG: DUF4860 domain-containing protein, partial [Firmicutes bacterium]|nr:DUF4860 domain-containing protein [Bacillota bacterium]
GIAALFLLGFLLLIVFGAQVYSDAVSGQDENSQSRALRSYLINCTQTAAAEDVTVEDGAESRVLVIRDSGTAYGLRIFLHEGQLVEYYGRLDAQPDPEQAQPVAETSVFTVEQIDEDVYAVTTDAGRSLLHAGGTGTGEGGDTR